MPTHPSIENQFAKWYAELRYQENQERRQALLKELKGEASTLLIWAALVAVVAGYVVMDIRGII